MTHNLKASRSKLNCFQCKHFYVTWDQSFPKGCRAMGFKGKEMPSVVVYRASEKECLLFAPKKPE